MCKITLHSVCAIGVMVSPYFFLDKKLTTFLVIASEK